jgi:hypothetical protein
MVLPIDKKSLPRDANSQALIGDTRDDENLIVARRPVLFIRFHKTIKHINAKNHQQKLSSICANLPRNDRYTTRDFLE